MTCKDCVLYERCQWLVDVLRKHGFGVEFDDNISVEKTCDHFKNKAEIVLEEIDNFRSDIMSRFIDMCGGNDYNKVNLLQIGDTIDHIFDLYVKKMIFEKEGADNG